MKFSVLMSVYHKEKPTYLDDAIKSVWEDQVLKPNQIVLVKDGALTCLLDDVINKWQAAIGDGLEVVSLQKNQGLAAALNFGLRFCRYELIARMDTDDISLSNRFKDQVSFMVSHPEVCVCGGGVEEWSETLDERLSVKRLPTSHDDIVKFCKLRNPISHPSVIFRKSAVLEVGGYPSIYPEDYALWVNMINYNLKFSNISSTVLLMRTGNDFFSRRGMKFLKGEIAVAKMQLNYGIINEFEYLLFITIRVFIRCSPARVKKILYNMLR